MAYAPLSLISRGEAVVAMGEVERTEDGVLTKYLDGFWPRPRSERSAWLHTRVKRRREGDEARLTTIGAALAWRRVESTVATRMCRKGRHCPEQPEYMQKNKGDLNGQLKPG